MFGRLKHISFLLALALGLSFALPAAAQTSADEGYRAVIEPLSAAQFAEKNSSDSEGARIAKMLEKSAEEVVCGRSDNVCTKDQICLKATGWGSPYAGSYRMGEKGFCVPKGEHIEFWSTPVTSYGKIIRVDRYGSIKPEHIAFAKKNGIPTYEINRYDNMYHGLPSGKVEAAPFSLEIETTSWFETKKSGIFSKVRLSNDECFTTTSGKKVCAIIRDSDAVLVYAGDDNNKAFNGCEVLPVKLYNMQGCFFCPLARLIFDTSNEMTKKSFGYFAGGFIAILVVMFAIWLALAALQQVFSMTKQDAPKFLSAIVRQGFKFLLAGLLLANSNTLFEYFIVPVLEGGLAMGQAIQTEGVGLRDDYKPLQSQTSADYFNLTQTSEVVLVNGKETTINKGLYQKIDEYLANLQGRIAYMQAVGTTLFCVGGHEAITLKLEKFKSGLSMMFLGAILTVFGFLLTISFGFYFLDAILQLAILGVMMPFMIAGWPFKITAQYASTGFKMLLNTFFVMFFTGFVVSVSITLVDQAISQTAAIEKAAQGAFGLVGFVEAFNEQDIERVRELTDLGSSDFLLLIFACLFGFKFVGQVTPLAGKLASGGLKPLAGKIGTMAASATKGMATKVTAPVRQGFEKETGGVMGIAAGTAGGIARAAGSVAGAVGKGLSKGGEALSQKGKVGKAAGWVVNKAGQVASGLGKGASGVGNIGKKVQQAYKDEANRPKK